ncbi:hypothetical protein B0H10DRAFT_2233193 [Mycena sp. CBHHK59/15]|nr:hypothetical protein B0H10DRAFT_2233193 [Mycena sp. CBHHK59/15]
MVWVKPDLKPILLANGAQFFAAKGDIERQFTTIDLCSDDDEPDLEESDTVWQDEGISSHVLIGDYRVTAKVKLGDAHHTSYNSAPIYSLLASHSMSTVSAPGRKAPDFNNNHFTCLEPKGGKSNRYYWKCKYCGDNPNSHGAHIEGRDNNLLNHIQDNRKCPNAPTTARAEALRILASKKPLTEPAATESASPGSTVIDADAITAPNDAASAPPVAEKRTKRRQGTLDNYVNQPMTIAQKDNADRKWLRFLIHANVSFRSSENEYLGDFLNDIRPSYNAPSRYELSHTLLDAEAADVFLKDSSRLQKSEMLTLLEDGWEDRLKRS